MPPTLARKTRLKFLLRRLVGELYVGKRMKMHYFSRLIAPRLPAGARILEVGCEDGVFTDWLARRFPNAIVEGLDRNAEQVAANARWAEQAGRAPRLSFRHGDIRALDVADTYDLIACFDVLGYILDDADAIRRLARALKPGGRLLVHQPNPDYQQFHGRVDHVTDELAAAITEGHVRQGYSPPDLRRLLTRAGLEVERIVPLHGRWTDLAHRVYAILEHPAPLRFLSLPLVDALWLVDQLLPSRHGNTVFGVGRRPI